MNITGDLRHLRARRLVPWGFGCAAVILSTIATPAWAIGTGGQPPRVEGRARVLRPVRPAFVSSTPSRHQAPTPDSSSVDRPVAPMTRRPVQPQPSAVFGFRAHERRLRGPHHAFGAMVAARSRKLSAARSPRTVVSEAHIAAPAAVFHDANAPPRRS
jgi:hypothetical protein